MTPDLAGIFARFVSSLRAIPSWVLIGLAATGYALLYAPSFGGADVSSFRSSWASWCWVAAVSFTVLALARLADSLIEAIAAHRSDVVARKILRPIPLERACWWHAAKQQDGRILSQICVEMLVTNLGAHAAMIAKLELLRPRRRVHNAHTIVVGGGNLIPPRQTVRTQSNFMLDGLIARPGKAVRISIGITDQSGERYVIRKIVVTTRDKPSRRRTLREWWAATLRSKGDTSQRPRIPVPWAYNADVAYLKLCDSILSEEQRRYAAQGRLVGGLGSLSMGIHAGPPAGGGAPPLLWDPKEAPTITSPNLDRMVGLHGGLSSEDQLNLEQYLLTRLDRDVGTADVAYIVFLSLHRFGRTIDALKTARSHLSGDKVHGYSNLLAALSGVVSREHDKMPFEIFQEITTALDGDQEPDFNLRQRLTLARLHHFDREIGHSSALGETQRGPVRGIFTNR